ncbi:DUF4411 family protein [Actinomyces sp. 2119]|uniref:DUF4411 family protein n=1 Tax=Actinomyces lilanjuaniae TaxID=2321394 RepID=A0ABN5PRF8_9ACTO|nr:MULTISPECIES: DUF4411 family protein [Actinomyces]AYD90972.1 DUF4411 family protein [Actinomyces lilanjuaniae]RJF40898.1 DUF4411 family protein [Actinomyces sp. 2119]
MYLVDANVLIEAKNRYYAFDIAPGFWTWLEHAHEQGTVFSIEKVGEELRRGDDELAEWAEKHRMFFHPIDDKAVPFFAPLSVWAQSQNFKQSALDEFSSDAADYLLVAHAAAYSCTLVTHEVAGSGSLKKVKIPDACRALDVTWVSTFEMLRRTGVSFGLRR